MTSSSIHGGLHYWLVDHSFISNFEWNRGTTFGSSPQFLTLTVTTYLSLTFLLLKSSLPPPPPSFLRLFSIFYNLTILLISLAMAVGCTLSAITSLPIKSIFCFPRYQPRHGPVFFWAYVFYLSKILEFVDTVLIILGGKGKGNNNNNNRRLSFLHVYHHAVVVVMCYVWLEYAQSLFPVALVTNATVHTVMYAYYLMCAVGVRPSWKRAVTDCQITQFVFSFVVSGVMLYYHFGNDAENGGCSGFAGWCFNAVFNASLLYLFLDFHKRNYQRKKAERMKEAAEKKG